MISQSRAWILSSLLLPLSYILAFQFSDALHALCGFRVSLKDISALIVGSLEANSLNCAVTLRQTRESELAREKPS